MAPRRRRALIEPPPFDSTRFDWTTCTYCGATGEGVRITKDHVVPTSRGGQRGMRNVVPACDPCNGAKGSMLPAEWLPDRPDWPPLVEAALAWHRACEANPALRLLPNPTPKKPAARGPRPLPRRLMPLTWRPFDIGWCQDCGQVVKAGEHAPAHMVTGPRGEPLG